MPGCTLSQEIMHHEIVSPVLEPSAAAAWMMDSPNGRGSRLLSLVDSLLNAA